MPYHPIILPLNTKVVVCLLYNGFYSLIDLQLLLHLSIKCIMWRHISYKVAWDVIQLAEEFSGHLEFFQNYPRIKIVFRLFSNSLCVVWFLFYVLAMKKPHQTFLLINWIYLHLPSWFLFCVFLFRTLHYFYHHENVAKYSSLTHSRTYSNNSYESKK